MSQPVFKEFTQIWIKPGYPDERYRENHGQIIGPVEESISTVRIELEDGTRLTIEKEWIDVENYDIPSYWPYQHEGKYTVVLADGRTYDIVVKGRIEALQGDVVVIADVDERRPMASQEEWYIFLSHVMMVKPR